MASLLIRSIRYLVTCDDKDQLLEDVDLYVHILGVDPQQPVPDEAPHIVGSAPGLGHGCGNLPGHENIFVFHRRFRALPGTGGSPGRRR